MGDPYSFWYTPGGRILVPCADRMSAPFHKADSSFAQKARTVSYDKRLARYAVRYSLGFPVECLGSLQEPRWRSLKCSVEPNPRSIIIIIATHPLATGVPSGWKAIHTVLYMYVLHYWEPLFYVLSPPMKARVEP